MKCKANSLFYILFFAYAGRVGAVQVSLPDTSWRPGDTLLIPIRTGNLTGLGVYSFETTITFDSSVIRAIGAKTSGSISAGWGSATFRSYPNRIIIAHAGTTPLTGSGNLIYIEFTRRHSCAPDTDTTILHFNKFMFNEGTPGATLIDGRLIVTAPFYVKVWLPDTFVRANDTIWVPIRVDSTTGLKIYSFQTIITFNPRVICPIGVETSGSISAGWGPATSRISSNSIRIAHAGSSPLQGEDTTLIYIKFLTTACTPTGTTALRFQGFRFNEKMPCDLTTNGSLNVIAPFKVRVWLPDSAADHGVDTIQVPILVDTTDGLGIYSYELELTIDNTSVAKFVDTAIAHGSITQSWGKPTWNMVNEGKIIIAGAGSSPLSGNDTPLVWIKLWCEGSSCDSTLLRFTRFMFNEGQICDTTIGLYFKCCPFAVELREFSVIGREGYIELRWATEAEIDNYKWVIVRAQASGDRVEEWNNIAELPAKGSLSEYRYIDSLVMPGITYWYKLGDVDNSGNITWHGPVSASCKWLGGKDWRLEQAIPSPFNEGVRIEYHVPGNNSIPVSLKVYDESGKLVKVLVEAHQTPGRHVVLWDGTDSFGNPVPSGTYFYSLKIDGKKIRKLIRIK